jgi:hypothetical protein
VGQADAIKAQSPGPPVLDAMIRVVGVVLLASCWISAAIFGAYILAFYVGAVPRGTLADWNHTLPRLYEPATPLATLAMGGHFLTGAILLLLGPVQFIGAIRRRAPAVHRWFGRLYVLCAFIAGVAGLSFILAKGTIGGTIMSVGFGLYGALTATFAVLAYAYGRARRLDQHRAWALRLFALAIGSWLYRLEYGFWILLTGGVGSNHAFSGPFDHVMAFFFYLPNLVIAELYIRATRRAGVALRVVTLTALVLGLGLTWLGTYFFVLKSWWPGILRSF